MTKYETVRLGFTLVMMAGSFLAVGGFVAMAFLGN